MSLVFCNIDLIIFVNWRIDLIILALCNFVLIYFGPSKYWFDNFGLLQHWFVLNTLVLGSVDEGIGGFLLKSRSPMSSWHFTRPWSAGRYLIEIRVSYNFAFVVLLPENDIFLVNGPMKKLLWTTKIFFGFDFINWAIYLPVINMTYY